MITFLLVLLKGKEYVIFLYGSIFYLFITITMFGFIKGFSSYLLIFLIIKIYSMFKIRSNNYFDTYFAAPGGGKSTTGTSIAMDYMKKHKKVFANFDVKGTIYVEKKDIRYSNEELHDCLLVLDEVGLMYDNRGFKTNFTEDELKLFKKHRHRHIDIIMFSQSWEDMDKKLRALSTRLFLLKRSIIPFFIKRKMISKKIDIDKDTKQIIDSYAFVPFGGRYIYMPRTWKSFNSFD